MTARVAPRGHDPRPPVPSRQRPRAGFTLIELMIVIVIIILLIALLVPAIGGALRNAREGQVKQEIGQLEYAIADFKAHFGMNPPSYIDLRLFDAAGALDPTTGNLKPATQAVLRRLWPNINMAGFTADLRLAANHPKQRELDGSACLVFFLGGVVPPATLDASGKVVTEVPVGFSSNPRSPLSTGGKRVGPFFEFRLDRLYDFPKPATVADFNGYEGYLDPLPGQKLPYWYVGSDRYAAQETLNTSMTAMPAAAGMRPVYRQGTSSYFNANTFQIISSGPDGVTGANDNMPGGAYGAGGLFDPKAETVTDNLPSAHALKGQAIGDLDNITNFHGGRLVP